MTEPRLTAEDRRLWDSWRLTALAYSRTSKHDRVVGKARRVVGEALLHGSDWAVMWSGGKDSTALAHLVTVDMGLRLPLVSEKDDLDYPGEREYVTKLAAEWGADLQVLEPPVSPAQWMRDNARTLDGWADVHSRAAGLSKECFYNVVEQANNGRDGVFLGLRSEESKGRALNRATHGLLYRKRSGLHVAQPLGDWSGLDVYAYLFSQGIPVLPVYQCVAFCNAREPWRVRKSWWLPGAHGRKGQVAWLRHYWPSLYMQLCDWLPNTKALG